MDRRLEQELWEIETACASIEAAIGAEDWPAAGQGNRDLNSRLESFGALLADSDRGTPPAGLELAATRLARVLEHHGHLAERLIGARDETGNELAQLRAGHRVASHYLETADS